jgi:hypothetical protein
MKEGFHAFDENCDLGLAFCLLLLVCLFALEYNL